VGYFDYDKRIDHESHEFLLIGYKYHELFPSFVALNKSIDSIRVISRLAGSPVKSDLYVGITQGVGRISFHAFNERGVFKRATTLLKW
jgi:hypothetical protein